MKIGLVLAALFFALPGASETLLTMPMSVRAAGMGEAYTAADDDLLGIHYNPAIGLKSAQLSLGYQRGVAEDHAGTAAFGAPTRSGRYAGSVSYYAAESIMLQNLSGNTRTVSAQNDYLALFSYAAPASDRVSLGVNLKVLHTRLLEEFKSTSYLGDAGLLFRASSQLFFGASAQNLGSSIDYGGRSQNERLFRGGASYSFRHLGHRIAFSFDQLFSTSFSEPREHAGAEYLYANTIAFRAGYKIGYSGETVSWGLGIVREGCSIDLAWVPNSEMPSPIKAALTMRF